MGNHCQQVIMTITASPSSYRGMIYNTTNCWKQHQLFEAKEIQTIYGLNVTGFEIQKEMHAAR